VGPYTQGNFLGGKDFEKTRFKFEVPFRKKWKLGFCEENATEAYGGLSTQFWKGGPLTKRLQEAANY
jgi:hypothetical protein